MRRLLHDTRGAALIEFALVLPVVLLLGGYGVETANLALTNLRISQIALTLADNGSRLGAYQVSTTTYQVQERDLNDILQGAKTMGAALKLTANGRVTLSSLENVQRDFQDAPSDAQPVQRIHWQRCVGKMSGVGTPTAPVYDSSYGQALPLATAGTDTKVANDGNTSTGMGNPTAVTAPSGTGTIFVEINYLYQPIFRRMFITTPRTIHYTASFVVRDNRDFSQLFNSATKIGTPVPSTCDKWTLCPGNTDRCPA